MSQKELAKLVGVQHTAVSNWENAINSIDIDTLFKVCEVLDISINTVFGVVEPIKEVKVDFSNEEKILIKKYRRLKPEQKGYIKGKIDTYLEEYSSDFPDKMEA